MIIRSLRAEVKGWGEYKYVKKH